LPPSLATLLRVSSSAAWSPLSSCGASPPALATLSLVSSSADARPLLLFLSFLFDALVIILI